MDAADVSNEFEGLVFEELTEEQKTRVRLEFYRKQ